MISGMRLGAIRRTARIVILLVGVAIAGVAVPMRDADTPKKTSELVDINRASTAELKSWGMSRVIFASGMIHVIYKAHGAILWRAS